MRYVMTGLFLLIIQHGIQAKTISEISSDCELSENAKTVTDISSCMEREVKKKEAHIIPNFQAVLSDLSGNEEAISQLSVSQKKWEEYMNATCVYGFLGDERVGSDIACRSDFIDARIKTLKRYRDSIKQF